MTATIARPGRLIGASVQRVEDRRILTGTGRFIDDVVVPGMLHVAFLRSTMPHAGLERIDVERARRSPGVVAVVTGRDLADIAMMLMAPTPEYRSPIFNPLAVEKVRFVGDPIALVVAETRYLAEDAIELIEVDYAPLPSVGCVEAALASGAPVIFENLGDNVVFHDRFSAGDVDSAFAAAAHVVEETFVQHRYANVPIETRGGVATWDAGRGELEYQTATQAPHVVRMFISMLLGIPVEQVRVRAGDIGGSFGLKWSVFREDVALCAVARMLKRPVKWIEDRQEHLLASGHARQETVHVRAAVDAGGKLLGLRANMLMDHGAYPVLPFAASIIPAAVRVLLPGPYEIGAYEFEATVAVTNKCSYVPYRGPWAVETWVRERLLDVIARTVGLDPVEVRRRNLASSGPGSRMISGPSLEGVTARETLDRAFEIVDARGLESWRAERRERGEIVGFGLATFIEPAPGPRSFGEAMSLESAPERAQVRIESNGHVVVFTAQTPHGQGHETTLAQVAATEMGVPLDHVRVVHGDTAVTPFSLIGTGGSRSARMAGGAVLHATRQLRQKVLDITSLLLEANPPDLEISAGRISVVGTPDRGMTLAEVAAFTYMAPRSMTPPGIDLHLEAALDYDGDDGGWSQATHCCWVAIDPETGLVRIERYLVVEDCGEMINPAIVDGQIRGGVAQGIGAVLLEHAAYGDAEQFLASTFMDYLLPTAMDVPAIEVEHLQVPRDETVSFRGVGEGGAIIAPAALTNAIEDAVYSFGGRVRDQYLPPDRILQLLGVLANEGQNGTTP